MAVFFRRTAVLVLAWMFALSAAVNVWAEETPETYVREILNYYMHYQESAQTDIDALLSELAALDWRQAAAWEKIIDNWTWVYKEMEVYPEILPDGLPEDDSLCIVTLGYQLTSNGGIQQELEDRLEVTLRSAEKYPNAYILCTGGATAARGNGTEAQAMAKWLTDRGIREERIILETESTSTTENALYSYDLLRRYYPQVGCVAIVTSDYHVFRSCMMFNAVSLYGEGCHGSRRIDVVGNAVCAAQQASDEGLYTQTWGLAIMAGVEMKAMTAPVLSELTQITAEYRDGFRVTAHYDSGISRDVTLLAGIAGFDPNREGQQEVTVTYVENGVAASQSLFVAIEKPVVTATEIPSPEPPPVKAVLTIAAVWLLAVLVLKWRKIL